jgi:hypothetical protein
MDFALRVLSQVVKSMGAMGRRVSPYGIPPTSALLVFSSEFSPFSRSITKHDKAAIKMMCNQFDTLCSTFG